MEDIHASLATNLHPSLGTFEFSPFVLSRIRGYFKTLILPPEIQIPKSAMTNLVLPSSKRPRTSSFADKHPESHAAAASDFSLEKEIGHAHGNHFLEICRFCKKKLIHDEDVFMYGYLGAFCSKKCREKQIIYDICMESIVKCRAKKGRTCGQIDANESKEQTVEHEETLAVASSSPSPRFYI